MLHTNSNLSENPEFTLEDWRRHQIDNAWKGNESAEAPVEAPIYVKRRSAGLWTAVAMLAAALVVVSGYGYWILSQDNQQLSQLPGITRSLEAVGSRLMGIENNLNTVKSNQAALSARTKQMDQTYSSGLERAQTYTRDMVASLNSRLQRELNNRTRYFEASLARHESDQQREQLQLAELKKELADTREQLASVTEKYTSQMAALQRVEAENQNRINSINGLLATDQVNFEVQKDQEQEIAPGISLHLTNVDVHHQVFDGWISFSTQKQMIRIHNQGIQQAVVFYPTQNSEAYKLIVTQLHRTGAVGYLYVPAQADVQQTALGGDKTAAGPSF